MRHIAISEVEVNGSKVNSVNARDLHRNFDVKTKFPDWIKRQLDQFTEGKDFLKIEKPFDNNTIDYIVTIETAKHIAMLQKNKKGMETRQYFIDVENQARNNQLALLKNHIQKTKQLFIAQEEMRENHRLLLETQEVTGETISDHDKRIANLEKNTRIESWQQKDLLDLKNTVVYRLGGDDKKLTDKLHRTIWKHFKNKFNLPRYDALTQGRYQEAMEWLDNVTLGEVV